MAYKMRKDPKGRTLKVGETYRKGDGRYCYSWTNPQGERKCIYAGDLPELRNKEKQLIYDLEDGVDPFAAEKITVNQLWDRYISHNYSLKVTTRNSYMDAYDRYTRDSFGKMKISKIKYTDVKKYYFSLINDQGLAGGTVERVHTNLHPAFQMAVRDEIIRINPTDGVMKEIKRSNVWREEKKKALTIPQQNALVKFLETSTEYNGWYPLIIVLLGTGMRIGECLGLRWEDIDFEEGFISVNHALNYRPNRAGKSELTITTPKTEAGTRTIPIIDKVQEAFIMEYELQKCVGFCKQEVDGYRGFVFSTSNGNVYLPGSVNQAINRITDAYNGEEKILAKKEKRPEVLIPHFSCHILRHTFCTRLCENESNIKVIQSVMGHKDIQTTLDIYADCTKEKQQEVLNSLNGKIIM